MHHRGLDWQQWSLRAFVRHVTDNIHFIMAALQLVASPSSTMEACACLKAGRSKPALRDYDIHLGLSETLLCCPLRLPRRTAGVASAC